MTDLIVPVSAELDGVVGPPQGQWTYADWEQLPDDGNRYEIIDGVLYVTTAPRYFHQWIIRRFDSLVGIPAEEQRLAFAATAPIGLFMPGCDPVQPDFILVLAEHVSIIEDGRFRGIPDLIVEVLSPGSRSYDEKVKLKAYARCGVPEYAVIDPKERQLRLYTLQAPGQYGEPRAFNEGDTVTFACLPTIAVAVSKLFEGAPDTTV